MTVSRRHPTPYEDALFWADENLRDLAEMRYNLPLDALQEYAEANLSQEICDSLDRLEAAACVLVYDGPEVIEAFARAAGVYDELMWREQEREDRARAVGALGIALPFRLGVHRRASLLRWGILLRPCQVPQGVYP